ncbi:tRNA-specific adenosine deaminase [Frankia sp. AgKG'84/4]|uniref:hypothetical protein n=1 Tax=Frankia sp. AgKG'84/4 TaxID=573490 RepID=UPI0020109A29|nr:hypothetical protein [Frankia sp. AgKG'84/4]MCL9793215.1 hypothetical protein [Frankia sp. AgKG'84/4]
MSRSRTAPGTVGLDGAQGAVDEAAHAVRVRVPGTRLGSWDLSSVGTVELVVNWRPCVMCYGAVMWSGGQLLTIAGEGDDVTVYNARRGAGSAA